MISYSWERLFVWVCLMKENFSLVVVFLLNYYEFYLKSLKLCIEDVKVAET